MVFLGTITQALAITDGRITRARMQIDRAYKGVSENTLILYDNGMCNGPNLIVGEQYLMYTGRQGNDDVPSRGCSRSRHVKYAEEDLKYLNGLSAAPPTSKVFGKVVVRTDDYYGKDKPVSGSLVEIHSAERTYTATTDSEGRYSFENLQPAEYTASATHPGFRMLSFTRDGKPESVSAEARGCVVVDMVLRKKWSGTVEGRLIGASGKPAPSGVAVSLLRMENRAGKEPRSLPSQRTTTNDEGEYSFREVAPGQYKIVMNLYRFPTARRPYPTIYWPTARTESEALVIEVTGDVTEQRCDFKLPPEPKNAVVRGIVLGADGKPVAGAQVMVRALPDNSIGEDDENRPKTNAAGRFSFTAVDGFDYRISANTDTELWLHSATVPYSVAQGPEFITLVLDRPGRFDDDPAVQIQKRKK
jgi:hypothetical protein